MEQTTAVGKWGSSGNLWETECNILSYSNWGAKELGCASRHQSLIEGCSVSGVFIWKCSSLCIGVGRAEGLLVGCLWCLLQWASNIPSISHEYGGTEGSKDKGRRKCHRYQQKREERPHTLGTPSPEMAPRSSWPRCLLRPEEQAISLRVTFSPSWE